MAEKKNPITEINSDLLFNYLERISPIGGSIFVEPTGKDDKRSEAERIMEFGESFDKGESKVEFEFSKQNLPIGKGDEEFKADKDLKEHFEAQFGEIFYSSYKNSRGIVTGYGLNFHIHRYYGNGRLTCPTQAEIFSPDFDFTPRFYKNLRVKMKVTGLVSFEQEFYLNICQTAPDIVGPEGFDSPEDFDSFFDEIGNWTDEDIKKYVEANIPDYLGDEYGNQKTDIFAEICKWLALAEFVEKLIAMRDQLLPMLESYGEAFLILGKEFIEKWKQKLLDLYFKIDSQFKNARETQQQAVQSYVDDCRDFYEIKVKLRTELQKVSSEQDGKKVNKWNDKLRNGEKDMERSRQDLRDSFKVVDFSVFNTLQDIDPTVNNPTFEQIDAFEKNINPFCEQVFEDAAAFKDRLHASLDVSNLGRLIDEKFQQLKDNAKAIYNTLKDLIKTGVTAAVEPFTNVVVTPHGPGAVTGNKLYVTDTIIRIKAAAQAIMPCFGVCFDAAIFLKLPPAVVAPIMSMATIVAMIEKLPG